MGGCVVPRPGVSEAPEVKEIEGLRGGVLEYAAQAGPKDDAEIGWIGHSRTGTSYLASGNGR